jgi:hypothetical protein
MLITGSLKVTALATRVPATLLMKSPSVRGMRAWTAPSMRVGTERKSMVRVSEPLRMSSRRSAVD